MDTVSEVITAEDPAAALATFSSSRVFTFKPSLSDGVRAATSPGTVILINGVALAGVLIVGYEVGESEGVEVVGETVGVEVAGALIVGLVVVGETVGEVVGLSVGLTVGLVVGESVRHVNVCSLEVQLPFTDANVASHALLLTTTA